MKKYFLLLNLLFISNVSFSTELIYKDAKLWLTNMHDICTIFAQKNFECELKRLKYNENKKTWSYTQKTGEKIEFSDEKYSDVIDYFNNFKNQSCQSSIPTDEKAIKLYVNNDKVLNLESNNDENFKKLITETKKEIKNINCNDLEKYRINQFKKLTLE